MPAERRGGQPDAVLLDMDGTLVLTEERWGQAERLLMADLGGHWSQADQAHALGGPLERVIAYMIGKSGGEHDHAELLVRLVDLVEQEFRAAPLEWAAGMLQLLDECHNRRIPTALVTASSARLAAIVVDALAHTLARAPFAAVITAEDVVHGKPAPDPYVMATMRLDRRPERCLAFEDSPTGVRSAVGAGCRVIGIEHLTPLTGVPVLQSVAGWSLDDLWHLFGRDGAKD